MKNEVDSQKFPTVADYLRGLPTGFESYPECATKGDVCDYMRTTHPDLGRQEGLPRAMREFWERADTSGWISETLSTAFFLALWDSQFNDFSAFRNWSMKSNLTLFDKPWTRMMMRLLSPTLVVLGAAKRWGAFHRGSILKVDPVKKDNRDMLVHGVLKYPAGLFVRPRLDMFGVAFVAALTLSRAENARYSVHEIDDSTAAFDVTWTTT